ncbi:MAG: DUF4426 domain-containing protein [Pseudomonadota bacterium]
MITRLHNRRHRAQRAGLHLTSYLLGLLMLFCASAQADSSRDFGAHVIHCKAVPSRSLDGEVAAALGITPLDDSGVLTIAIMEKTEGDDMGRSSQGKVTAHWSDLTGMMGTIPIREVTKEKAIYYVGEFELPSSSMMTFDLLISVDESRPPYRLKFKKKFEES